MTEAKKIVLFEKYFLNIFSFFSLTWILDKYLMYLWSLKTFITWNNCNTWKNTSLYLPKIEPNCLSWFRDYTIDLRATRLEFLLAEQYSNTQGSVFYDNLLIFFK